MRTVKEIWNDLFDSSLECYENEDEAIRNLSMILHVLKLEYKKAGELILELKRKNESQRMEISECKQKLGSTQLCECKNNNRRPLKTISTNYNETTPKKNAHISTSLDISDSEDLFNHQITELDLSKDSDNSLFVDNSVEDFDITISPTLTKHKSNRLSRSKIKKEVIKNTNLKDLIVMNTPTPKINKSKKFKQTKLTLSSLSNKTKPPNFTVTKTDSTNVNNSTDNDETLFISAQQKNISLEKVPTDTEVMEILEDLKENASPQNKRIKLDNSYDCIPEKEHENPDFAYKREAVRKKSERMKLQGWECQDCEKYYATYQNKLSAEELQKRMNQCSRHRDKFNPNIFTPKGFWNPEFSPTQNSDSLI